MDRVDVMDGMDGTDGGIIDEGDPDEIAKASHGVNISHGVKPVIG